jgi:hypothetical protein
MTLRLDIHRDEVRRYLSRTLDSRPLQHTPLVRAGLGMAEGTTTDESRLDYAAFALAISEAFGHDARGALPAAAAVAFVTAAVGIREDLKLEEASGSMTSHWRRWGMPRTLNAADAMISLAHLSVLDLGTDRGLAAARLLDEATLLLSEALYESGQGAGDTSSGLLALAAGLAAIASGSSEAGEALWQRLAARRQGDSRGAVAERAVQAMEPVLSDLPDEVREELSRIAVQLLQRGEA